MRVSAEVTLAAEPKAVWAALADLPDHPEMLAGVTRWAPAEDGEMAVGSRYDVRMQVGAAQLGALIEITEMIPGCELAWTSLSGVDHRGRFTVRDGPHAGTARLRFRLAVTVPGGLVGVVAGRAARPILQANADATVRAVRRRVEGGGSAPPARGRGLVAGVADTVIGWVEAADVLRTAGLLSAPAPAAVLGGLDAVRRYGMSFGTAVALGAARFGDRAAIVDAEGTMSYAELERATNALAAEWASLGIAADSRIGILARNGRRFVVAVVTAAKLGADVLLLNTAFSGPQARQVLEREGASALVTDADLAELVGSQWDRLPTEGSAPAPPPPPPGRTGRQVILTSGTTGTPKGAQRDSSGSLGALVALLSRVPLRARETTVIATPMFHAWGFAHLSIGLVLGSTLVLRSKFDPAQTLADVAANRATALVVVPVMVQRLLEIPAAERPDTATLRVVACSGSALPGHLATRFMDEFGDVLYNLYGSTEVAWATIAGPEGMRLVPGTAGRPPRGTVVKILDADGTEVAPGMTGRIFVGNDMAFEGYTGGDDKERVGNLLSTGDLGHWDWSHQLTVEGREDDMIVSGGENVFPGEVEDVLAQHPAIADVAVVGVEDPKFGQALVAFVVSRGTLTEREVRDHVKRELASFKTPQRVEFVDALPRNATGKILRRELQERAAPSS
ncbi:MAG: AMP-binding protein [Acidimicrobiales bacterium]